MNKCGIYLIENIIEKKFYVGSTKNFSRREIQHFGFLRNGKHSNKNLQKAYNNGKEGDFVFKKILYCSEKDLLFFEQRLIDFFDFNKLYNISPTAGNSVGTKRTEDFKKYMSKIKAGTKLSDKTKHKMSKSHLGVKKSKLHAENIGKAKWIGVSAFKNGYLIKRYDSLTECAKDLGVEITNISKVLKGKLKTTGGYTFIKD